MCVRLVRKSLPTTNTLAYYKHSSITAVKSFVRLTPDVPQLVGVQDHPRDGTDEEDEDYGKQDLGPNVIKPFTTVISNVHSVCLLRAYPAWSNVCGKARILP